MFGCVAYAKVSDHRGTKLDAKGVKCMFFGYFEGTKVYRLICLEMKKIIKNQVMMFFEVKIHLEDCPNGRIEETLVVKVDISPKPSKKELEANDNVSKLDKKLDIEGQSRGQHFDHKIHL